MKTFVITGGSDDVVHAVGVPGAKEFYVNPTNRHGYAGTWVLTGPGGSMRIVAYYGPAQTACWGFLPMQVAEDIPYPDWPTRIHSNGRTRGYSTVLEIEVPEGTVLVKEDR